jgi:hypothetical protein
MGYQECFPDCQKKKKKQTGVRYMPNGFWFRRKALK